MAVQTHNDTVMTANLTTLAEENAGKEVTAVHFYLCVCLWWSTATQVKGQAWGKKTKQPRSERDCC